MWRGIHTPGPGKGTATTQGTEAFFSEKRMYHAVGVAPEFSAGCGITAETKHRA